MGYPSLFEDQSRIEHYRYRILSIPPSDVAALADLYEVESEEEQKLDLLLSQIRNGRYSDLDLSDEFAKTLRPYPAYNGVHVNEPCIGGYRQPLSQLDLKINAASTAFRASPRMVSLKDLHYCGIALPGQLKDPQGRQAAYCSSCGKPLPHGEIKAPLDGSYSKRAKEQHIHCSSKRCPVCLRYNLYLDSDSFAQRLWAARNREARAGSSAIMYQIVLSPPKRHKDPLAVYRWTSKEGIDDLKKTAILILKDLGALGGSLTMHHFAQNGADGMENAAITGNNGDPNYWRLAIHFHSMALFDTLFPIGKVGEIYKKYGWTVKLVLKKGKDGKPLPIKEARIKKLDQLKNKLFYLQSHASVVIPDDGGRCLDSITWFGCATHRKLREITASSNTPLIKEGYTEIDEEGRVLYWYEDLRRFAPLGLETLAEVERVNSARVYVDAADYGDCMREICGLCQSLGIPLRYESRKGPDGAIKRICKGPAVDIPPRDLWRLIGSDPRFIKAFEPMAEVDKMRPPRKDQIDGRFLWMFRENAADIDEFRPSAEYQKACEDADRREAEYLREKQAALARAGRPHP